MSKWDGLSLAEKAEMMKVAIDNGIYNLNDIKAKYNEFAGGGSTDADLVDWIIREEGFNKKPEDIGDGKMTLGSGLTAKKWHDLYKKKGNKWSATDNRMAVTEEVANRRRWAEKNIPNWDTLPESSQKALLSYKYNYDFTRGNSPKLFAALKAGDLQEAARQMDATSKDPKFQKGLKDRRKREQDWFLSEVTPSTPQIPSIPFEQPVSTFVYNPYVQQQEQTQVLPVMIPDENTYVTTHSISPSEQRRQQIQEAFEARNRFNTLMQMVGVENTAPPLFMPTNSTPLGILSQLTNTNANGGDIHIKKSHRGRLTELKKRTGKTEAELYNDGNPAHKKMVVFARNARKFKHDLGGPLVEAAANYYDGTSEPTQKMQIGLNVQGWPNYTLDDILANAEKIEQQKRVIEEVLAKKANDYLTTSNDATSVATGRKQNQHLADRAIEGAKTHRAWEEEHPNFTAWGNAIGAIPFAVASIPIISAAMPLASSAITTAEGALQAYSPALYSTSKAVLPWINNAATAYFGYQGAKDVAEGKFTPSTALNLLPATGKIVEQGSRIFPYRRLEKNYTGVPHNQSKDINGQPVFYKDGSPVYMDTSFPAVHKEKTVWTTNDIDYAKLFATPDKANQPIGTVFDVYTDPKKLSVLNTPIPESGTSYYWQGLPFKYNNGKLVVASDTQRDATYGIAKNKNISIQKGGQSGKYNPDELTATIMRKGDIGTINWDKNPSALKTDDIVDFSNKHGYDATKFYQIQDGPSLINGEWHYYPIDELVLNPGAEKYILPHGAPKFWLWNQIPKKQTKLSNGLLPLLSYPLNQE